jgi:hypothetical protein
MPWNFIGDGMNIPITNMIDMDGIETMRPESAVTIVALLPDGQWLACECAPHEIIKRSLS